MSDDIKQVLFGKTTKVNLADGNEYTMRELNIMDLNKFGLLSGKVDMKDVDLYGLLHCAFSKDHPDLTAEKLASIVPMSYTEAVVKGLAEIGLGGGPEKNGLTRA